MTSKWIIAVCIIRVQCLFLAVTDAAPSITLNGSSSSKQTYELNDNVTITCKISSNYTSISSFYIRRGSSNYHYIESSNTGSTTKTINCDDNFTYFRCYGTFNGTNMYSSTISVTVNCPPTWAESVKEPVSYSAQGVNKYFDLSIISNPKPIYSVQKYTSSGLQDLPTVDVTSYTNKLRLYFVTYSEESHGIYQIKANNSIGKLTTNVTLRGLTLPPECAKAWSTTPNSIHVEWKAGELFETAPRYNVYYKLEYGAWISIHNVAVNDIGSTVTYIFYKLKSNTTYYFLVTSYSQYGTSVYSNLAQATTLTKSSDPPQPPPICSTVPPTLTSSQTPLPDTNCVKVIEQDDPTFGAGIGIGLGIGLMFVVLAIIGTVIYFKRTPTKQNEIPKTPSNGAVESESGNSYATVTCDIDFSCKEEFRRPTTGVSYDNQEKRH